MPSSNVSDSPGNTPLSGKRLKRDQNLRQRYGIGLLEYEKLLAYQGGVCAICGGGPDTKDRVFAVDHDHVSGRVRGLVCKNCNTAMGHLQDNPERAARVKLYLETHQVQPILPASPQDMPLLPQVTSSEGSGTGHDVATDPRIPTPEVIAALKGHGLTLKEISDEFDLTLAQTKRLYTEAERGTRAEFARDWLFQNVLPGSLKAISDAVLDGDAKIGLAIVKGLGALREVNQEILPQAGETRTFEQWRATVTRVTRQVGDPVDTLDGSVVASTEGSLRPPVVETTAPETVHPGSGAGRQGSSPKPESSPEAFISSTRRAQPRG